MPPTTPTERRVLEALERRGDLGLHGLCLETGLAALRLVEALEGLERLGAIEREVRDGEALYRLPTAVVAQPRRSSMWVRGR